MARKVYGYEIDPARPGLKVDREYDLDTGAVSAGTPAAGVTAVEHGDGQRHRTVLTVDTTLPAIAGGANLGVGKLLYTLPAGAAVIHGAKMDVAITQTEDNITADTPDVGIGTTIASGAVAVLSGTAAFENVVTGQTATDCDGTNIPFNGLPTANADLFVAATGGLNHTVYLNVADGWAADGDAGALLTGTVILHWSSLA